MQRPSFSHDFFSNIKNSSILEEDFRISASGCRHTHQHGLTALADAALHFSKQFPLQQFFQPISEDLKASRKMLAM